MSRYTESILRMLASGNGFVTATQITEAGIPRRCLSEMVAAGILCKVDRGIYAAPTTWEDDLHILQYRFAKGIFSHETALYLHSMTDRTPIAFTMTFPRGYNTGSAARQGVLAQLAATATYPLGVSVVQSPGGYPLKVYDIERTLCDIVKPRHHGDIQVVNQAMRMYSGSRSKDIAKLMDYAAKLHVSPQILRYMEVLL